MTKTKTTDWDSPENEVPSNWVTWGVPGDKIFGTLISKRTMKSTFPGKEGEIVNIYEIKAEMGQYHKLDAKKNPVDPAIIINIGEFYNVGGKTGIDVQMKNVKLGQTIGMKFIDETPSNTKGFAPAKSIKVFAPKNDDGSFKMDEEWVAQNGQAELAEEFNK